MANRQIIWAGALPLDTDLLYIEKFYLQALGFLAQATLGSNTICDGLQVTQTTVPSLGISISPGSILYSTIMDTSSFGSLPLDNTPVMKMGINPTATTLPITAPGTAGYSQNYLIEAAFLEQDGTPVVLPYYNASNPSQVYNGPNNTGTAQNTVRAETVSLVASAGTPAPTGTQATPATNTGYIPLAVVTIAYGQTAVTNAMISPITTSYVGTKLGQLPTRLSSNLNLYVASPSVFSGASDSNSGLSVNTPFATLQGAYNALVANYNLNNYSATINVGAGNFGAVNCAGLPQGYGANSNVLITGAGATTIVTSTGIQSAIGATLGAAITITNMQVTGTYGVQATNGSLLVAGGGMTYGTCTAGHIIAGGGSVTLFGNYNITGAAPYHWSTQSNGSIACYGSNTITGTGTQNFSTAFVSTLTGNINVSNFTFSGCGSFTGKYYSSLGGGYINSNGLSFPGNAAGTTGTGTNIGFFS